MVDSSLIPPKAPRRKLCFVIGPIGSEDSDVRIHADWLLEEIIQPVMATFLEYDEPKRADQDHRPGLIDAQLINDLLTADLVIADLSGLNPNSFYEIGIRHMVQKPIIHMQLANENIPFDVSLYRAIKFSRARPKDILAARLALKQQIEATHAEHYQVENPVTRARGIVRLEEHATPAQQVIFERFANLERRLSNVEQSPFERLAHTVTNIEPPNERPSSFIQRPPFQRLERESRSITYFVTRRQGSPPQVLSDIKRDIAKALPSKAVEVSPGNNPKQMGIYSDKKHRKAIEIILRSHDVDYKEVL